ncbi:MAG: hypothetical protein A4E19_20000 [Nitrospira sp. SG-bin1]|nr:MAG: hypothetical protein A4E19_20000 [Nitrospira sp. SG-bin1]
MLTKLSWLWDMIRGSLWFVPSIMAAGSVTLAFTVVWIDHHVLKGKPAETAFAYGGGADGAREVLSTVAGAMITVAGVIFSITVVALTLASQQFGPRLLRNFMHDRGNQVVLGTFISIHLYCLIILRAVRGEEAGEFVPHLSVSIALVLALTAAGVLIYFFHHATSSIRASSVIAKVALDLDEAIDRLFPQRVKRPGPSPPATQNPCVPSKTFDGNCARIESRESGYLQMVNVEELVLLAARHDLTIRLDCRPGDFITCESTVATIFPAERVLPKVGDTVCEALILGDERTMVQDMLFPAQQLTEIAVRALSPSMNDPTTALACIDRLGAAMIRLGRRRTPSPYRYDDKGRLRLVIYSVSEAELIEQTMSPIRQYGHTSALVTIRLLDTCKLVTAHLTDSEAIAALERQVMAIDEGLCGSLPQQIDREQVRAKLRTVRDSFAHQRARCSGLVAHQE